MEYSSYQIALISILVVNLIFWSCVVCFRLFFDFSCSNFPYCANRRNTSSRRRRRRRSRLTPSSRNPSENHLMGLRNPAFTNLDESGDCPPYNITGSLDPPPSYEEALQSNFHPNSQSCSSHTCRVNSTERSLHAYSLPATLSVPEETTSTCEVRFQTSLNSATPAVRPQVAQRHNENTDQLLSATCDMTCFSENNAESSSIMAEEDPLTFVINNIGKQSVKVMGMQEMSTTLTDGELLQAHSSV